MKWRVFGVGALAVSCGGSVANEVTPPNSSPTDAVPYEFVTTVDARLGSKEFRGRSTIILFATTFDLNSQGAIALLNAEVKSISPRINALVVMVEPPRNMDLIRTYVDSLSLEIPVGIADEATFRGKSPWGPIRNVPTFIVLDSGGRLKEAYVGLPSAAELQRLVRNAR